MSPYQTGSFIHPVIRTPLSVVDIWQSVGLAKVDILWNSIVHPIVQQVMKIVVFIKFAAGFLTHDGLEWWLGVDIQSVVVVIVGRCRRCTRRSAECTDRPR
jgi:hypothetical protein